MRDSNANFLLKLVGGLLLAACIAIIYLGSVLFDQGTRLTHAGRDQRQAEIQRDALAALLGTLTPNLPLPEAEAAAKRAGVEYRIDGDAAARRLVVEDLSFPVRDGMVSFERE